ncbi:MAG: DUF6775 family putative metallopeptidase [Candidatus Hydrothermarchaeaceae archaeon]
MKIFLYSKREFSKEIKEYLGGMVSGAAIKVRGDFIKYHAGDRIEEIGAGLAGIRVADVAAPFKYNEPLYGEIEYEKRVLFGGAKPFGVLYDGLKLYGLLQSLIPEGERNLDNIHIILTDRLFGTFDEDDLRYHARVIICGFPSIISTTGIVEAPAKPREFYVEKQFYGRDELALEELKRKFKDRFIDYGDSRMAEILKGYVMQAVFYQAFREAFCEDKDCRLYNAHWQEEMINAQLNGPEFCKRHEGLRALL